MTDPTPTPKEQRAAADEQRAQQQAVALRGFETDVLSIAMRAASDSTLDWAAVADALDRVSAATRMLAGGKK